MPMTLAEESLIDGYEARGSYCLSGKLNGSTQGQQSDSRWTWLILPACRVPEEKEMDLSIL